VNVPYKFTGKELDSTGLYYYEARYYDPTLGRFISPDIIVLRPGDPQELNRYTYAKNNPMLYTDPTGNVAIIPIIVGIFVTAAVSTVTSVAIAAATGGDLIAAAKYGAVSGAIAKPVFIGRL
jgi:RHS repeat-associated protein